MGEVFCLGDQDEVFETPVNGCLVALPPVFFPLTTTWSFAKNSRSYAVKIHIFLFNQTDITIC
jgi:hypothetical protein